MNAASLIETSLLLLQIALDAANKGGTADPIIADLEAAIAKLQSVQGTDVTWSQLQGLRVSTTWPSA